MKRTLLLAVVFCFYQLSYAESAIIDHIIYDLNLDDLTATVLNFQTNTEIPCDVKIPGYVLYKNDTYKVTRIEHKEYSEYDYKYRYNYEEARANIEHIELPNTLECIVGGAFAGMRRLKALIIPASVKTFNVSIGNLLSISHFVSFPRLETITVLGTPSCERGNSWSGTKEVSVASQVEKGEFDYIKMMAFIVAEIDTITNESKLCPNLKSFNMPKAKEAIEAAKKNKSWCSFYNAKLEELCTDYNAKLKEHAFYDGTILTHENVKLSDDLEEMRLFYNLQKENLSNEYNALLHDKMEMKLRKNNKEKYIECYKIAHPEKIVFIDSILLEYSCHYYNGSYKLNDFQKLNDIIIDAIDGKNITLTSCREMYYQDYAYLFKDREEYDERYNMATSYDAFTKEIEDRKNAKECLRKLKIDLTENPTVKLQGMSSTEDPTPLYCMGLVSYCKAKYYYDDAVTLVLTINEKAKKEYEKNGHYFNDKMEFFEAYISSEYKTTLKNKIKAK